MHKLKKYRILVTSFLLSLSFCFSAKAGDINGDEQSVLSAAQGQFEYNGETYRAKQEYVNALIGYLQQDDVNLSASDAQAAISQIYANVQTGVESGYLEKVGGTSSQGENSSSGDNGGSGGGNGGDAKGSAPDQPSQSEAAGALPQAEAAVPTSGSVENNQSTAVENTGQAAGGESEPESETTAPTIPEEEEVTKEDREILQKQAPREIQILEEISRKEEFTGGAGRLAGSLEPDSAIENRLFTFNYKMVLFYALSALLVVTAFLGIIIFSKQLYRYHQNSKKQRKMVRTIAEINLLAATFILLFIAGLGLGVFRDTLFQKSLDDTGYYEKVYDNFILENESAFDFLDIPEEIFKSTVSYEQISMAARQQMENDLHQGSYQVNVSVFSNRIKSRVRDYIRDQEFPMTQSSRKGLDLICQYLEKEYAARFHWKYASLWGGWHEDYMAAVRWLLPMSLLLLIAGHLIIISTHHFKHRGIRQCGFSIGAGSAIYVIFNLATRFFTEGKGVQRETYVDEFLFQFLRQGIRISLLIGLVGICFALGYLALAKATKEGVK